MWSNWPKISNSQEIAVQTKYLHRSTVLYVEFEFEDEFQIFQNFDPFYDVTSTTRTGSNGPKFSTFLMSKTSQNVFKC